MTDLVRLLDGEASEAERALLESARLDRPSPELRRQTIVALGLASGAVAVGASMSSGAAAAEVKTGASAASSVVAGGAATKSGASATALVLAKWLVGGAVAGVLGMGALSVVFEQEPSKAAPAARQAIGLAGDEVDVQEPRRANTPRVVGVESAPVTAEPERLSREADEKAPVARRKPHSRSSAKPPVPPEKKRVESVAVAGPSATDDDGHSSVLDEVASLDAARRALAAGQSGRAVDLLVEHERRFAHGILAPEARVLRIRALLGAGRVSEAERLGRSFLAHYPSSLHAKRIRELLNARY